MDAVEIALEILDKYKTSESACIDEWSHREKEAHADLDAEVANYEKLLKEQD